MNIMNHTGKARSIPMGLAFSLTVSLMITFMISAIIAASLNTEKITWSEAGYWILGMLLTAAFIGGKCAYAVIKRQRLAVSIMSGVVYWSILLCITALFFGGDYGALWETAGIIAAGSCTSALICLPDNKNHKHAAKRRIVKLNKNPRSVN